MTDDEPTNPPRCDVAAASAQIRDDAFRRLPLGGMLHPPEPNPKRDPDEVEHARCPNLYFEFARVLARTAIGIGALACAAAATVSPDHAAWLAAAAALGLLHHLRKGPNVMDLWLTRDAVYAEDDEWPAVYEAREHALRPYTPPPPPMPDPAALAGIRIDEDLPDLAGPPPQETCTYCGHEYPAPVSLHHSQAECLDNQAGGSVHVDEPCEYPYCAKPRGHEVVGPDHSVRIAALGEPEQM